jgi:hypothetical protein
MPCALTNYGFGASFTGSAILDVFGGFSGSVHSLPTAAYVDWYSISPREQRAQKVSCVIDEATLIKPRACRPRGKKRLVEQSRGCS